MQFQDYLVLIRGAGSTATAIAITLRRAGFPIVMLELPEPRTLRRMAAFAEAVQVGMVRVENVTAQLSCEVDEAREIALQGDVAVMVDATGVYMHDLRPVIVLDARVNEPPYDTLRRHAPLVLALSSGVPAALDVDAVVDMGNLETVGQIYWHGDENAPRSLRPRYDTASTVYSPVSGTIIAAATIGARVATGDTIACIETITGDTVAVAAPMEGVVAGALPETLSIVIGDRLALIETDSTIDVRRAPPEALRMGEGVFNAITLWMANPARLQKERY